MDQIEEFSKVMEALQNLFTKTSSPDLPSRFSAGKVKEVLNQKCECPSIKQRLEEEFLGSGPLLPLTLDQEVTEIIIDGRDNIFFEKKGKLFTHDDAFLSSFTFENFVHRVSASSKVTPNIKTPWADGKWKNFRAHIITSPLVKNSHHITLRRHPKSAWTFDQLESALWAPPSAVSIMKELVEKRMNILIAGPASSGKTSVLNACLNHVSPRERVITIEDSDELAPLAPYSVKLLTRSETQHLTAVSQADLVSQSLRMRPDRIVMGEVRGPEAKDLILALATGHSGSMGTIHASHHKQALLRLELLVQLGNLSWSSPAVQSLIHLGLQAVVLVRKENEKRILQGIYHITGLEKTGFLFDPLFQRKPQLLQLPFTRG